MLEHLAKRPLAGADDQEVELVGNAAEVFVRDLTVFDVPATLQEILHKSRMIDPVIDGATRLHQVAIKIQGLRTTDGVVMPLVAELIGRPVVAAKRIFPLDRDMMMRDGIQQTHRAIFLGPTVGIDRRFDTLGEQVKTEVKPGGSRANDSDSLRHVSSVGAAVLSFP